MTKGDSRKESYFGRVQQLIREYKNIFIVNADNVTSTQMHQVRSTLRNQATILMGKNTMVRKAIREILSEVPKIEALLPHIRGNIGLIFTNGDLKKIRDLVVSNKKEAPPKIGVTAQQDISVPAGNTGIQPDKTSFFQALGIPTKVVKGAIEIVSDSIVVKAGQKVGASEAELMNMLGIMPFSYGFSVEQVYQDGTVFAPEILDITNDVLLRNLASCIRNIAALSLATKYPTVAAVPHCLANAYKNVLAIGLTTEYSFPAIEKLKKAMASAATTKAAAPVSTPSKGAKAAAPEPVKQEEESEEEFGLSLFD